MKSFGARDGDFKIYINNAKLFRESINGKLLDTEQFPKAKKLIDSIQKISKEEFDAEWSNISNQQFDRSIAANNEINSIISTLNKLGIENVEYNPILTRGFDYYTGTVFEVYDTNPENRRALFGGGRFDDLLSLFGDEKVPAVGFGMGDVTMRDFLEVRGLLPQFNSPAKLYIVNAGVNDEKVLEIASQLREKGVTVAIDLSGKKIGDQIKKAVKDSIEFVIVIGENELSSGEISIKHLSSEKEEKMKLSEVADYIKNF
jgi:histidyl-tRNA synthetase